MVHFVYDWCKKSDRKLRSAVTFLNNPPYACNGEHFKLKLNVEIMTIAPFYDIQIY